MLYKKPGPGWLWWCARRCCGARRNRRGQMGAVGPGVPDHQHRARGTCIPGFEAAAAHAYTCRREAWACAGPRGPGFAAGAVISADAVLMPVPVGAGLLAMVPAGVLRSAGGSPWSGPQRLGAALKQVFILEFDTRNAPIVIKLMHTQLTKKHASECCVQLGVLAYANLMHMMHSYVHLYAQVYMILYRHIARYRYCTIFTSSSSSYCINHHHSLSSASSLPSSSASASTLT